MPRQRFASDARRELRHLKAELQERRRALIEQGLRDDRLNDDWRRIVRGYSTARRWLSARRGAGDMADATVEAELDALRSLARKWVSRVDARTARGRAVTPRAES
jgi:hypothetical protein